jgi:hypothetical protein
MQFIRDVSSHNKPLATLEPTHRTYSPLHLVYTNDLNCNLTLLSLLTKLYFWILHGFIDLHNDRGLGVLQEDISLFFI